MKRLSWLLLLSTQTKFDSFLIFQELSLSHCSSIYNGHHSIYKLGFFLTVATTATTYIPADQVSIYVRSNGTRRT